MKRLLIALSVLALNGCALYDAYMMTGFDSNEYRIIAEIRTEAGAYKTSCNNPLMSATNSTAMAEKTRLFMLYSEHIPKNTNVYNASKNLDAIAQGLAAKYKETAPVSPVFCKLKYESIESSANAMQTIIGKRPR
jgi:hypothetical protein